MLYISNQSRTKNVSWYKMFYNKRMYGDERHYESQVFDTKKNIAPPQKKKINKTLLAPDDSTPGLPRANVVSTDVRHPRDVTAVDFFPPHGNAKKTSFVNKKRRRESRGEFHRESPSSAVVVVPNSRADAGHVPQYYR